METLDRILNVVVETQSDVKDLKTRVGHLEDIQEKYTIKSAPSLKLREG